MIIQTIIPMIVTAEQRDLQRINQSYQMMVSTFDYMQKKIWANPDKAQEVLNKYGTDAVELFKLSAAFQAMLQTYTGQPVPVMPEGWIYEILETGCVKVTKVVP